MNQIQVNNITKQFGKVTALEHVNVTFEYGKIYGLLGRNGAGKSTLLNIISNRLFADDGEVLVNGERAAENDAAQQNIYIMSEKTYYPETMKIKDAFRWSKEFYPGFDMEYAQGLAKQFQLDLNKKVKSLSTGYGSIFKLIIALSVNTPYVFLDEPVLGLDANHRDLFYRILIEKYSENPSTIIISTHLIEEVSGVIEEVIIIDEGRVLKSESRDHLLAQGYTVTGKASEVDAFAQGKQTIGSDTLGGIKSVYFLGKLEAEIPQGLEVSSLDLQKLFIQLTGKEGE